MALPLNLRDVVGVRPLPASERPASSVSSLEWFQGASKLVKMGNNAPIAYGGTVISQCLSAAFASLPASPDYELYSVLGSFLGPGSIEVFTRYEVEDIRTTRSFATRKVVAWQDLSELPADSKAKRPKEGEDGKRRIMILLFDFQVREKLEMFDYSPLPVHAIKRPPVSTGSPARIPVGIQPTPPRSFLEAVKPFYGSPDAQPEQQSFIDSRLKPEVRAIFHTIFPLFPKYYAMRAIPNAMGVQVAMGIDGKRKTTQDDEILQRRTNAHWVKTLEDVDSDSQRGLSYAATAFLMDSALAFLPLTFTHQFLFDVQAVSSLELSLRFLCPPRPSEWCLHEQNTEAGMRGRTFSTGRLWNSDGRLVAVMTQASIMRGKPENSAKL